MEQDAQVAGPEEVVISKEKLDLMKKDLKAMGKELRNLMMEKADNEKTVEKLKEQKRLAEEVKEQKRIEIRELDERLAERIRGL